MAKVILAFMWRNRFRYSYVTPPFPLTVTVTVSVFGNSKENGKCNGNGGVP